MKFSVCMLVTNSAPFRPTPHVTQHGSESALLHNSFALPVRWEDRLLFDASYEAKYTINNRKLVQ